MNNTQIDNIKDNDVAIPMYDMVIKHLMLILKNK